MSTDASDIIFGTPLVMYQPNRNVGHCCTGPAGTYVQVAPSQCACLFYLPQTSSPALIATGSAYIFTSMFDYVAQDQQITPDQQLCLLTASPD